MFITVLDLENANMYAPNILKENDLQKEGIINTYHSYSLWPEKP